VRCPRTDLDSSRKASADPVAFRVVDDETREGDEDSWHDARVDIKLVGDVIDVEVIAVGRPIRELERFATRRTGRTQRVQGEEASHTMTTKTGRSKRYVLCLSNRGYNASLVVRRVYEQVPDSEAARRGLLRVVDESGEDYLFPRELFAALELPSAIRQRLAT
jgi:hypothetical protein